MKIKKKYVIWGILALIFIVALLPWLKEGVPATDDYRHHAMRTAFIKEQVSTGEFSEWMPHLYGGWAFSHFYHPFFYILSLPFILFSNPFAILKLLTVLTYLITLGGTFYAGYLLFKDKEIALIAAVAYFLSSHFLFHATVSGALPRLLAIGLVPIASALFIKALEEKSRAYTITSGIGFAILIMTHISVAVPVLIMAALYALYYFFTTKNVAILKRGLTIAIIALALSAFWLLPLLAEKEHANFSENGKLNKPYFEQTSRTFGIDHDGEKYIRSNYFGYSVLALAALGLVFIKRNKTINTLKFGFVASIILYFNMFNILNIIPFIKTALTGSTGFFISMVVFNGVMLAGAAGKSLSKRFKKDWLVYVFILIIAIELYPALNSFSYNWSQQPTEHFLNPPQLIDAWDFVSRQDGDFAVMSLIGQGAQIFHGKQEFGFDWVGCPQCVDKKTYDVHNEIWQNLTKKGLKDDRMLGYFGVRYLVVTCNSALPNKLAYSNDAVCVYENELVQPMIESHGVVSDIKKELDKISFTVTVEQPDEVLIKSNYFEPHWHATVNGKETVIKKAWPNFMVVNVPKGENDIVVDYRTNRLHLFSWLITLFTIGLLVWRRK